MLLVVEDGTWRPGLGDPTFVGWLTVVVYFGTAWLCWRAFVHLHRGRPQGPSAVRIWWLGLVVALVLLGINKQLDLQTLLTQMGKALARSQGWYDNRRAFQLSFIVAIGAAALGATVATLMLLRRWLRQLWVGVIGFGLLLGFVVIRAASFHHMDQLLGVEVLGLRFNWLMELGPLLLIAHAAARARGGRLTPRVGQRLMTRPNRNRLGREEVPIKIQVRSLPPDRDERSS